MDYPTGKETSRALSGYASLPFQQLLVFPLGDDVSRALEPVEEHDATKVIVLVLEDTGDEACELAFALLASGGLVAGPDAAMTGNLATDSGDAQAAFPTFDHVLGSLQDLRVDHDLGLHRRRLGIAGVGPRGHDEKGNRFINLGRRDAHAVGLAQRRKHVVDQCPHLDRGGALHRSRESAKDGMPELGNLSQNGHGAASFSGFLGLLARSMVRLPLRQGSITSAPLVLSENAG